MRISTSYQFSSYTGAMDLANEKLFTAQQQAATGLRINTLSDDPSGVSSVLTMQSLQNGLNQYKSNLNTAKGVLSFSDSALSDTSSLLNQAYSIALQGANAATDQSAMQSLASQVGQLQTRLVQLANSQGPAGQYLFAGQKNDAAPYAVNTNTLSYNGDSNQIAVQVGPGDSISSTVDASTLFTTIYSQLETLKNNLASGNTTALSSVSVADMQGSIANVNLARGDIGSRLQTINNLTNQNVQRSTDLSTNISNIRDVDAATAITQYQAALTAYQAALSVANSGLHMSLMDYLKL